MPEGHTIHRVARDHTKLFAGEKLIVSSPQGRFEEGAKQLTGKKLQQIEAIGKHLFYVWQGKPGTKRVLHIHLGLYGKFRVHKKRLPDGDWPEPRGAVRLRLVGNAAAFDLNGPNCCELLTPAEQLLHFDRLGPDPLRDDADPERAWERIHKSRAAIGGLLLNQEVIAGVGNIYRAEVLHLLGIHPDRPGKEIERDEFDQLWKLLIELLTIGMKHNRIIISDPQQIGKPRSRMNRDERLRIYKKPNCPDCGTAIEMWTQAARKIFACPVCQS